MRRSSAVGAPLLFSQAAVAIAVVAIAGAALQAFDRLSRTDIGFATSGVTLIDTAAPGWKYESPAERRQLTERLLVALRDMAGVEHVAAVSVRPFRFGEIVDGLPVRRAGDALVQPADATGASRVVATRRLFRGARPADCRGPPLHRLRSCRGRKRGDRQPDAGPRALGRGVCNRQATGDLHAEREMAAAARRRRGWRCPLSWAGTAVDGGLRPAHVRRRPSSAALSWRPTRACQSARRCSRRCGASSRSIAIERIQTTGELVQSVLSPARLLATLTSCLASPVSCSWRSESSALPPLRFARHGRRLASVRPLARCRCRRRVRHSASCRARWALAWRSDCWSRRWRCPRRKDLASPPAECSCRWPRVRCRWQAAATIAVGPSLWRATRRSPAELLRES